MYQKEMLTVNLLCDKINPWFTKSNKLHISERGESDDNSRLNLGKLREIDAQKFTIGIRGFHMTRRTGTCYRIRSWCVNCAPHSKMTFWPLLSQNKSGSSGIGKTQWFVTISIYATINLNFQFFYNNIALQ